MTAATTNTQDTPKLLVKSDPKDDLALLGLFGDFRALRAAFGRHGMRPPTSGTVRNWRHRGEVPDRWRLKLYNLAVEEQLLSSPRKTLAMLSGDDQ
jgi:hypothetical protein